MLRNSVPWFSLASRCLNARFLKLERHEEMIKGNVKWKLKQGVLFNDEHYWYLKNPNVSRHD